MAIKFRYKFLYFPSVFFLSLIIFISYYAYIQLNLITFKASILMAIFVLSLICMTAFYVIKKDLILALSAAIPLVVFLAILANRVAVNQLILRGELSLYAEKYATCASQALASVSEIHLEVCDVWDHPALQVTESIIYDASDQIELPGSQQSRSWVERARFFEKMIPIEIMGFTARRIEGHFFYVYFSYTEPSKLTLDRGP